METVALSAQARAQDAVAKLLRKDGIVPCVLYGNDVENVSLQCDHNELFRAYAKAGSSTLIDLAIDGDKTVPVLVHAIDFHPVQEQITHVDFYAVDMKKEIETEVPVHCVGESPAIKDLGGLLVTSLDRVTVRCLPANLPHALDVDISGITEFGMNVTVADIAVPEGVAITAEESAVLASVQEPRRVEVEEVTEGEEGEEGAEGEAAEGAEGGEGDSADAE